MRLVGAALDGLVLGSPVYIDLISGQRKFLIDRMADGILRQALAGKYGRAVAEFLNHVFKILGPPPADRRARSSHVLLKIAGPS